MQRDWKEITHVQQLTDLPYSVNLFVPSDKLAIPEKVEHMNAWLKLSQSVKYR